MHKAHHFTMGRLQSLGNLRCQIHSDDDRLPDVIISGEQVSPKSDERRGQRGNITNNVQIENHLTTNGLIVPGGQIQHTKLIKT